MKLFTRFSPSWLVFAVFAAAPSPAALAQDEKKQDPPAAPAQPKQEPAKKEDAPKSDPAATADKGSSDMAIEAVKKFIEANAAKIDKSQVGWRERLPKPSKVEFDKNTDYFWNLNTNFGDIKIRLYADVAPMHASSTIYLTQLGFYDDLIFHRVIPGFMAQGGCPRGKGMGGPGYQYDGEFDAKVKHEKRGMLSMAHRGPGTDGSQFFITFGPTPHLDNKHTIFGEVVSGMEVLKELEKRGSDSGTPSEKLSILKATISTAPKAAK